VPVPPAFFLAMRVPRFLVVHLSCSFASPLAFFKLQRTVYLLLDISKIYRNSHPRNPGEDISGGDVPAVMFRR
jgi:hypothetical protein